MASRLSSYPARFSALEEEQRALLAHMKPSRPDAAGHGDRSAAGPVNRLALSPRSRARMDAAELLGGMGMGRLSPATAAVAPLASTPPLAVPPLPAFPGRRNGMAPDYAEMDRRHAQEIEAAPIEHRDDGDMRDRGRPYMDDREQFGRPPPSPPRRRRTDPIRDVDPPYDARRPPPQPDRWRDDEYRSRDDARYRAREWERDRGVGADDVAHHRAGPPVAAPSLPLPPPHERTPIDDDLRYDDRARGNGRMGTRRSGHGELYERRGGAERMGEPWEHDRGHGRLGGRMEPPDYDRRHPPPPPPPRDEFNYREREHDRDSRAEYEQRHPPYDRFTAAEPPRHPPPRRLTRPPPFADDDYDHAPPPSHPPPPHRDHAVERPYVPPHQQHSASVIPVSSAAVAPVPPSGPGSKRASLAAAVHASSAATANGPTSFVRPVHTGWTSTCGAFESDHEAMERAQQAEAKKRAYAQELQEQMREKEERKKKEKEERERMKEKERLEQERLEREAKEEAARAAQRLKQANPFASEPTPPAPAPAPAPPSAGPEVNHDGHLADHGASQRRRGEAAVRDQHDARPDADHDYGHDYPPPSPRSRHHHHARPGYEREPTRGHDNDYDYDRRTPANRRARREGNEPNDAGHIDDDDGGRHAPRRHLLGERPAHADERPYHEDERQRRQPRRSSLHEGEYGRREPRRAHRTEQEHHGDYDDERDAGRAPRRRDDLYDEREHAHADERGAPPRRRQWDRHAPPPPMHMQRRREDDMDEQTNLDDGADADAYPPSRQRQTSRRHMDERERERRDPHHTHPDADDDVEDVQSRRSSRRHHEPPRSPRSHATAEAEAETLTGAAASVSPVQPPIVPLLREMNKRGTGAALHVGAAILPGPESSSSARAKLAAKVLQHDLEEQARAKHEENERRRMEEKRREIEEEARLAEGRKVLEERHARERAIELGLIKPTSPMQPPDTMYPPSRQQTAARPSSRAYSPSRYAARSSDSARGTEVGAGVGMHAVAGRAVDPSKLTTSTVGLLHLAADAQTRLAMNQAEIDRIQAAKNRIHARMDQAPNQWPEHMDEQGKARATRSPPMSIRPSTQQQVFDRQIGHPPNEQSKARASSAPMQRPLAAQADMSNRPNQASALFPPPAVLPDPSFTRPPTARHGNGKGPLATSIYEQSLMGSSDFTSIPTSDPPTYRKHEDPSSSSSRPHLSEHGSGVDDEDLGPALDASTAFGVSIAPGADFHDHGVALDSPSHSRGILKMKSVFVFPDGRMTDSPQPYVPSPRTRASMQLAQPTDLTPSRSHMQPQPQLRHSSRSPHHTDLSNSPSDMRSRKPTVISPRTHAATQPLSPSRMEPSTPLHQQLRQSQREREATDEQVHSNSMPLSARHSQTRLVSPHSVNVQQHERELTRDQLSEQHEHQHGDEDAGVDEEIEETETNGIEQKVGEQSDEYEEEYEDEDEDDQHADEVDALREVIADQEARATANALADADAHDDDDHDDAVDEGDDVYTVTDGATFDVVSAEVDHGADPTLASADFVTVNAPDRGIEDSAALDSPHYQSRPATANKDRRVNAEIHTSSSSSSLRVPTPQTSRSSWWQRKQAELRELQEMQQQHHRPSTMMMGGARDRSRLSTPNFDVHQGDQTDRSTAAAAAAARSSQPSTPSRNRLNSASMRSSPLRSPHSPSLAAIVAGGVDVDIDAAASVGTNAGAASSRSLRSPPSANATSTSHSYSSSFAPDSPDVHQPAIYSFDSP